MDTPDGDAPNAPDGNAPNAPDADGFHRRVPAGGSPRRVLFLDDEPGAADLAAIHVERLVDGVETVTYTAPADALAAIETDRVDCVVSDYDMPGKNGLELLTDVRQIDPSLPFVLFTGKGSEEIASEAISAGVTDYLQKGGGRDRYEMLANRVENALARQRVERDLRDVNAKVTALHQFAAAVVACERVGDVFELTVAAAEGILRFDRCVTVRREGDALVPAAFSDSVTEDEVREFEIGEGVVGRTAAEERTMVVDNLSVDPADPEQYEDPADPGRTESDRTRQGDEQAAVNAVADPVADDIRSAISVPIGSHGVLQAVSDGYACFDEGDIEFAELLAAHAADAIEQIETENALRADRDRLRVLFEDLPLAAARTVIRDGGEPRLDATNAAFERMFGYSADDHTYPEINGAIVPAGEDAYEPGAVFDEASAPRLEVRRETTDGVRDFILHVIPVPSRDGTDVYGIYADIGEQKRVERMLRNLHETTREMFRGEDREEIAALAARAAIDILGFPSSGVRLYDPDAQELLPTAISEEATAALGERPAFGPDDGRIWEAFETGEPIVVDDLDAVETSVGYGDHRSLLVVPLGDHGVMPLGSRDPDFFGDTAVQLARVLAANVTVALDDAERTAQLRRRDAALQREIDRLEKFAGLVSHDLRNPLNVATGRLELAQGHVDDPDVLDELDRIGDAHERMAQLIGDLLALARQGETVDELRSVDLAATVAEAWRTVDTGDAILDPPDESVRVDADPERLRTLLENLFTNSVVHGTDGSRGAPDEGVTDGSPDVGAVTVTVGALPTGFYVADDGVGFDADFDPDEVLEYGVSSDPRGTGFGLAIVREIAAAHGWALTVTDDDGARFDFRTDA